MVLRVLAMTFDDLERELYSIFHAGGSERDRYVDALMSVSRFLEENHVRPSIAGEFQMLASALSDLDDGIVQSFLRPNAALNRANDPTELWKARALVAIALDLMAGKSRNIRDATRFVASEAQNWSHLFKVTNFEEAARKWHFALSKRKAKNEQAQSIFDDRMDLASKIANDLRDAGADVTSESVSSQILMYAASVIIRFNGIDDGDARKMLGLSTPSVSLGKKAPP
jgi:hypothetical protein